MLLMKTLPSFVQIKSVTNGIIVAPNNHPEFEKLIELDTDIRDKVWNWIHNPTLQKKEDWIEECLKRYDWEDMKGNYILDSDDDGNFIGEIKVKGLFNMEGKVIKVNFGQYLNGRFYSEEVVVIKDKDGSIWIEESKCF